LFNALASVPMLLAKLFPGRSNGMVTQRVALLVLVHGLALLAGWLWGWWWAVAAGAAIAAGFCGCVLNPSSQWLGPVRRRNDTNDILVTIDDGPDPRDTPRLLDLLDRYEVKAVFFMIGEKVEKHPELAREVLRRGHEIGNHTMAHPQRTFWCAGPWRTRREIEQCQQAIARVTGVQPRRLRAPVGHRNFFTHPVAHELGLEVVGWTRRGFDAVETDVPKILRRILNNLAPGDIVLIHEGTPVACEVLEAVLAAIHDRQ
jgi:peptidoglycan/xylan/chitin deacetylase (PgdA/CDA1 family)